MSAPDDERVPPPKWGSRLARLLCLAGFCDWQVEEVSFGFAPGESVEKARCRRCGRVRTRRGQR